MRADGVSSLIVAAGERLARGGIREHNAFLGHEMRGPAGTGRGGVSMAGEAGRPRRKEGEWGEGPSLAITTIFCSEFLRVDLNPSKKKFTRS